MKPNRLILVISNKNFLTIVDPNQDPKTTPVKIKTAITTQKVYNVTVWNIIFIQLNLNKFINIINKDFSSIIL